MLEVKNPNGLKLIKNETGRIAGIWLLFEDDGEWVAGIRLDNDPSFPHRAVWAKEQFAAAEAKVSKDKQETSSIRPQLSKAREHLGDLLALDSGLTAREVDFVEKMANRKEALTSSQIEKIYEIYEQRC